MTTDTRTRAMTVYAAHFAAHGYRGASLEAVAREVGVRKPTLYHHFPGGKETLHQLVALDFIERRGRDLRRALDTEGDLDTVLRAVITEAVSDPTGADTSFDQHLFDSLDLLEDDVRTTIRTAYTAALLTPLTEHLRTAITAGELADRDPALLCNAFLHLARAVDMTGPDPEQGARALVSLFLDGARTP
ncbi:MULTISPECIES: TetR/AcrR family transcriptional regulator [Nocardiopsis]|uniref:TetR/AcrR family transcriptional regulator n=1 Tax=Nocardiopsis changdeensis TaxID=2831969 RepID=A0ABX8BTA5_9ACTN|nr:MULTISPECIES: TetR/AcrR family transcriptional regulator [Nocardiopsis]QUX25487.1 TetR/AcrR family transcriptional regulator [Nocardiopsis changdeensis]QYX35873.1 TetR/AcrR family transcriptional regulator [Nocardiopsis sp. MT53]